MIYGMYLSASGTIAASHQQDVVANNLANAETNGFKRQMAIFQARPPEGQEDPPDPADPYLQRLGGGQLVAASVLDYSAGLPDQTDQPLDVAVNGPGYLAVKDDEGRVRLTRNGNFMLDRDGTLRLETEGLPAVLGADRKPIKLPGQSPDTLAIGEDGTIADRLGTPLARLGVFGVGDDRLLRPVGGTLLAVPESVAFKLKPDGSLLAGHLERSNVEPTTEVTRLMEAQRQLEANSNLIRYQDQTLAKLVNEVGKIG